MAGFHTLISLASIFIGLASLCQLSVAAPAVCREWIKPFWDNMVLQEDRNAVFADLERYFVFIDMDGNGKVSGNEFYESWHQSTLMGDSDTSTIFSGWSRLDDTTEPDFIIDPNVSGIWHEMDKNGNNWLTEAEFETWWVEELKKLPKRGCPET